VQPVHPSHRLRFHLASETLERRSVFWSMVGLGMLLVIALAAGFTLRQVRESDDWVDHTRDVISNNQQLLLDVKDAESAERGYIITGDPSYLEPYQTAADDIRKTLARLTQLTADNPPQQQRLENLGTLIAQRTAVLAEAVRQRSESGFDAAEAVVIAGKGRIAMGQIRQSSREIEAVESALLQQRLQARQAHLRSGFIATLAASVLALVVLILAPLDVRRAVGQRNAAEQEKQESDSTVRALFEAAAQGIFMVDRRGRIVLANPAAEKMLGYAQSEIVGQSIELLVPEKLRGGHVAHRESYFGNPQDRPMGLGLDLEARRKDGSTFDAEISLSYFQSAQGTLAVAFVSDISKRKADEQAIRRQGEDLRSLAGRLMTAQDDERRRIARDLHDDLSQKLAYLAMDIGKLVSRENSNQELQADLRLMQRRAADAAESVRRISHQLHPSILDDIGLEAALEQYCEEFGERSGIRTYFSARNVPESLPRGVASSIYHIFQESLRNVSKHSEAKEAFVTLEYAANVLRLTVRDEGIGLSPNQPQSGASIGIVGMKERAHLVNGTVEIDSKSGEGTEVSVVVPISVS